MTISSTDDPRAGPFNGNGAQTAFPFEFKTFSKNDLLVVRADADGVEYTLVLDSAFSVALNSDQDSDPGGTVTYPISGTALPVGETLTVVSDLDFTQTLDITSGSGFYPQAVENALDRSVMLIKQVNGDVGRALQLAVSTPDGVDVTLPVPVAGAVIGWGAGGVSLENYDPDTPISTSVLRAELANPALGSALVGLNQSLNYTAGSLGAHLVDMPLNPKSFPWLANFDGVTDDTAAINACATAARAGGRAIAMPTRGTALVSGTLDFSGLHVAGFGGIPAALSDVHIRATSAQFDVISTTGLTTLDGLFVHGGWDGSTAGQAGDIISVKATGPAYPYFVHIRNCVLLNAKRRGIYIERGGYSTVWNVKCNASGLHGLEMFGNSGSDATTTVLIGGMSVFSDTPYGRGIKMTECINVMISGAISEFTGGLEIVGISNRSITVHGYYQENTTGGKFVTWTGSSGIGFDLRGCFGGGYLIDHNANWADQSFGGNSNLVEPAVPLSSRVLIADGGELSTAVAGSFTATSLEIPPGTWELHGYVQTLNSTAGGITQLGALFTTSAADAGINSTTGAFVFGADELTYNPGASANLRVRPFDLVQNTTNANVTYYLRTFVGRSAGTVAYRGGIKAVRKSA